jgi:hypothetical protein
MFGYVLPEDASEFNEEWIDQYPLEHFKLDFQKFEPRCDKVSADAHSSPARYQSPQIVWPRKEFYTTYLHSQTTSGKFRLRPS